MKKISITEKMILYFLLIGLCTIAVVGVFSYFRSREAIMSRTLSQLTSVRVAKKRQVEQFFRDRTNEITLTAALENSSLMISKLNGMSLSDSTNNRILNDLKTNFGEFTQQIFTSGHNYEKVYYLADSLVLAFGTGLKAGDITLSGYSVSDELSMRYIRNMTLRKRGAEIFDYCGSPGCRPAIMIAAPVTGTGSGNGVLCFEIAVSAINAIMLEMDPLNGLGTSGESYLVGPDTLMRSCSRFISGSVFNTRVNTSGIREAMKGNEGTLTYPDYRKIPVLGSYSEINVSGLRWVIAVEIDVSEAFKPVNLLLYQILFLSVFIAILLFIVTYVISKRITRPILHLREAALKVGAGNYQVQVPVETGDEIGELAEAFNNMAGRIKLTTDELREREQRLEHFYDATLDGIIIHDNGMPMLVNQAMTNLTGYTEDELMKTNVYNIFQERRAGSGFKIPLKPYLYETQAIKKDGSRIFIEVQESAIEYKGRMIKASVIRDVSKRIAIENQLREERLKRLSWVIDGQEIERQRLSRELHDGLGQSLIALKLRLENLQVDDRENADKLENLRKLFNQTIDEIRRISNDLMPAGLTEFGIINGLRNLCNNISEHSQIAVEFDADRTIAQENLSKKCITYLYRIAQEAINNSVKHADASVISVNLIKIENFLVLSVADNGKGFKFGATHKYVGNGIYNMRERVNMLHGVFEVNSEPGRGTEVIVKIPANCN